MNWSSGVIRTTLGPMRVSQRIEIWGVGRPYKLCCCYSLRAPHFGSVEVLHVDIFIRRVT